jgi:hypothetical protein
MKKKTNKHSIVQKKKKPTKQEKNKQTSKQTLNCSKKKQNQQNKRKKTKKNCNLLCLALSSFPFETTRVDSGAAVWLLSACF